MSRKEELLSAFDDSWRFRWESLDEKLKDMTHEEALFRHPMYADVEDEPLHPPSGTILWNLVHPANVYRWYLTVMQQRPREPVVEDLPMVNSVDEALANLRQWRQHFRDYVASLPEEALEEKHFDGRTPLMITRMMPRHDAYHTSQIAVIRRLYRTKA